MNTQAMYWSVRRELWENRSIYIAPLAVAAVMVFGFFVASIAALWANAMRLDAQPDKLAQPFNFAAVLMMATTFIVAIFYCLDALHGERRDRSVLFWKSMPVSDVTTVLSKAAIPLVVLPLITFVLTIAAQLIMLLLGSAVALISGHGAAALWTKLPWFQMSGMLLYHLLSVHSLYYAPIFGWLLLISASVKRAPILWALLPLAAIGIVEKVAFNTSHFGALLASRMSGGAKDERMRGGVMMLGHFNLGEFLSSPGLWIGLLVTAAFLTVAVRMRRSRAPI
jgi:ABC-2 type transport system permease protein